MATERKKRQAQKSTVDTSKLKEFASKHGGGESKGARRLRMAKSVKDEASKIQSQISREQEKAQKKSLWSSIGGALFGLAAGVATGGASWAVQGAAVGAGTYLGAHGGKKLAETEGGAKREKIKSDLWYTPEAEKQNLAFDDYEKQLNKGIQDRALASGLLTAAVAGGGKLIEKIKEGKKIRDASKAAEASKQAKDALGLPQKLEQAQKGADFVMGTDISGVGKTGTDLASNVVSKPNIVSETGTAMSFDDILWEGTDKQFSDALSGNFQLASPSSNAFADSSLSLIESPLNLSAPSLSSQLAAVTPETTLAAPTMMNAYMDGLKTMATNSMQKSILAGGAMGIYGYRPELQSLRPVQMMTPTYQTPQRTRTT
tara:strand:+ start:4495 stop:5613 length:1119 start_codon:yes stop_codon:yes gene_type:complete